MCVKNIFSSPKTPAMPAAPEPLPEAPKEIDAGVQAARDDTRRRAASGRGFKSTLLTPSTGLGAATVQRQTLLGGALNLG